MIRSKGIPADVVVMSLFAQDAPLKAHPTYKSAKAGDKDAALNLVLDLTNLGGTLAELANYIQALGGVIKDVVVLVNAGRNPALVPKKTFTQLIKERFDDEFTEIFGIEPGALTANEAQYLASFKSVDAIRNRLAAAEQEIDRRLRSKGITRASQTASPGAHAGQGLISPVSGADDEDLQ